MGYKFEKYSIGGGGSGIIDVTELPAENIDENAVYRVTKAKNVGVFTRITGYATTSLHDVGVSVGASPVITYTVVDSLPNNPNVSNLQTFAPAYVYIYNNVPYLYGNAGSGNMWLTVSAFLASVGGIPTKDKGYIENPLYIPDPATETTATEMWVYITYEKDILAVPKKIVYIYDGEWVNRNEDFWGLIKGSKNGLNGEVVLPNWLTSIRLGAFAECSGITSITIPDSVAHIGAYAFYGCDGLRDIALPSGITALQPHAFSNCSGLTNITIPSGVRTIYDEVFFVCTNLSTIVIPNTVTSIGSGVFALCESLTSIIYTGTKEQWKAINKLSGNTYKPDWNHQTPDYTITCTDGTIAKDGTET